MAREDNPEFMDPGDLLVGDRFRLDRDSCIESADAVRAIHNIPNNWDDLERDYLGQFPYRIYDKTRLPVQKLFNAIQPLPADWSDNIKLDIQGMVMICLNDIKPISTAMEQILSEIETGKPLKKHALQTLDIIHRQMKTAASVAEKKGEAYNRHVDDFIIHKYAFQLATPVFENAAASLVGESIRSEWGFTEFRRLADLSSDGLKDQASGIQLMEGIWQSLASDLDEIANLINNDELEKSKTLRKLMEKKISRRWKKLNNVVDTFERTLEWIVGPPQPDWNYYKHPH